jgi:hypothetical protein
MEGFCVEQIGGFDKEKISYDDFLGWVGNQETGCSSGNRFLMLKATAFKTLD